MKPRVLVVGALPSRAADIQRKFRESEVDLTFRDRDKNLLAGGTFDYIILWVAFMVHSTSDHYLNKHAYTKPIYVAKRGTSSINAAIRGCIDCYHQSPAPVARH